MPVRYFTLALLLFIAPTIPASAQYVPDEGTTEEPAPQNSWRTRAPDWTRPLLFDTYLPFNETALGGYPPAIRYNRTEGLVLGINARPLDADDWLRVKPVGQLSYAFSLGSWRYDAGLEFRPFADFPRSFGTRVGVRYRRNTTTMDSWKAPWTENTLAAVLFRNDFYDYYEAQGWSAYVVQPLSRRVQATIGFRSEDHRTLENETAWSIFGDGRFRPNPIIDETRVNSVLATVDAGQLRYRYNRPRGHALRLEFEAAPADLDNDLPFMRFVGDARSYGPVTERTTYAARLRIAVADADAPLQKLFTAGGVGTVRGYPINAIIADRMLLANVEYGLSDVDFLVRNMDLYGFADAAWTRWSASDDTAVPVSVGAGIGFVERKVRLEVAFPLRDEGTGLDPSLWFRLYPQF